MGFNPVTLHGWIMCFVLFHSFLHLFSMILFKGVYHGLPAKTYRKNSGWVVRCIFKWYSTCLKQLPRYKLNISTEGLQIQLNGIDLIKNHRTGNDLHMKSVYRLGALTRICSRRCRKFELFHWWLHLKIISSFVFPPRSRLWLELFTRFSIP